MYDDSIDDAGMADVIEGFSTEEVQSAGHSESEPHEGQGPDKLLTTMALKKNDSHRVDGTHEKDFWISQFVLRLACFNVNRTS